MAVATVSRQRQQQQANVFAFLAADCVSSIPFLLSLFASVLNRVVSEKEETEYKGTKMNLLRVFIFSSSSS